MTLRIIGVGMAAGLLEACAVGRPVPAQTIEIAVPVSCNPPIQAEPAWPDTDEALRAAPDLFSRVRLLAAGRLLRIARNRELEASLAACR